MSHLINNITKGSENKGLCQLLLAPTQNRHVIQRMTLISEQKLSMAHPDKRSAVVSTRPIQAIADLELEQDYTARLKLAIQNSLKDFSPGASANPNPKKTHETPDQVLQRHFKDYGPMAGAKIPIDHLIRLHSKEIDSQLQLDNLARTYPLFQKIAGDGNCFYTSFGVDFLQTFSRLDRTQQLQKIQPFQTCDATPTAKTAVVAYLTGKTPSPSNPLQTQLLHLQFVECLRAIGADYMERHKADFFYDDAEYSYEQLITDFRIMGTYAQQPMIISLVKALDHPIRIFEVKGTFDLKNSNTYDFEGPTRSLRKDLDPPRMLLFRSAHYDLVWRE